VKAKKGQKVYWAQIILKNKCQYALVLAKIFQYLFVHQKENPQKPLTKVKITKEKIQTTLENRKEAITDSPRNVFKTKNKVEKGGASSSRMKREHDNIKGRA
jgi:hypothetical protein